METQINDIINSNINKSKKMRLLFDLGRSRTEVAQLLGVGYGFVQNVYAKYNLNRQAPECLGDFIFKKFLNQNLIQFYNNRKVKFERQ